MKRTAWVLGLLAAALVLAGCTPTLLISNNTDIDIRVLIVSQGAPGVISLGVGQSMSIDVNEGSYGVGVLADKAWIAEANEYRRFLVESLANPGALTGERIMNVIAELQKISDRINQLKSETGIMCKGTVGSEGGALAEVNIGPNGEISVACH